MSEVFSKLIFDDTEGWYKYEGIPYMIWYDLNCSASNLVNKNLPGYFALTPNLGIPGYSLSVWIYRSVPKSFKHIVMFHELVEAKLMFNDGLNEEESHRQAVIATEKYAKLYLSPRKFEKFIKWSRIFSP